MRIVAGKYRHRLLEWPSDTAHIRPTKDRIRESVFNALGDLTNMTTLDLYAGSGAMGLEALSRNSKKAYFVDINPVALKTIRTNILNLNINKEEAIVVPYKDEIALKDFANKGIKFDLVILDPPYAEGKFDEIISILFESDLLTDTAIIVVETDRVITLPYNRFNSYREYKYGEIRVTILRR